MPFILKRLGKAQVFFCFIFSEKRKIISFNDEMKEIWHSFS